ncbi:MAG: lipid-A-disaccharide synthase N-terminal domain-containing protein [Planctomycetota bacterium]
MIAVGLLAQLVFVIRTLWQWLASERARRSVLPHGYWWLSLAGAALLLTYALSTQDLVFTLGPAVTIAIYIRNLELQRQTTFEHARGAPPREASAGPRLWLLAGVATLGLVVVMAARSRSAQPQALGAWFAVGLFGQLLWSARFVVQWWISERKGQSHLPAAFFQVSLGGAILLLAYALVRQDPVFILAYGMTPIPLVRNLLLLRRTPALEPAA